MGLTLTDFYSSFVNLDSRRDRLVHMNGQLFQMGVQAERTRGILPHEVSEVLPKMRQRTPGAIGCHYAQVSIMKKALELGKSAFVMEDDLIFCSDFQKRLDYIFKWMDGNEWDIFWLGSTFHVNPPYWHAFNHSQDRRNDCSANLGYDAKRTADARIMRTYGAFCTYAYMVNVKSLEKVIRMLDSVIHLTIGIDYSMIMLQPKLNCFAFVPGCVKQMDNESNIGTGMTIFSNFLKLNGTAENSAYVWQDKTEDFDPLTFQWHETN